MRKISEEQVTSSYAAASELYAEYGVDTDFVLKELATIPVSVHCWQGDDVGGFESDEGLSGGGILATGNYPGRARTPAELRSDLEKAYSLIPGRHRLNLHAIYGDFDQPVERNEIEPKHFRQWIDWARQQQIGLDFNPTCFSHPKAASGMTLAHQDKGIRDFWIEHCIACRQIGEAIGRELENPCVTNVWIPDGYKDIPIDRYAPRERLKDSLDTVFSDKIDPAFNLDAVEAKLFGIGAESCTIGSHEFYLGYAATRQVLLCLDAGHFHPTEVISDKLSAVLGYIDEVLLHVSRPVRWDSDHVVILDDELRAIAQELIRNNFVSRVHIGLDFFDASINRVAAWVIGTRSMVKALLLALLEPTETLRACESDGDFTGRLALLEELKSLPFGAVWDYYCLQQSAPVGSAWLDEVRGYERDVLSRRD